MTFFFFLKFEHQIKNLNEAVSKRICVFLTLEGVGWLVENQTISSEDAGNAGMV